MRKDWLWPPEESPGPLPLQDRAQKGQVGPSSTPGAASPFTAVTSQYCLGGGGAQPRLPACRLLLSASVSSSIISAKELWLLGLPTRPARLGVQRMDWSPQLAPCANRMRCRPPSRAGLVVRGVDEHKAPGTGPAWHMLKLGKHQLRSALEVLISRTWGGGSEEPQARCPISIPPYPGAHPTWGHQRLVTATAQTRASSTEGPSGTHDRQPSGSPSPPLPPHQLEEECGKFSGMSLLGLQGAPHLSLIIYSHAPRAGGSPEHSFLIRAPMYRGPFGVLARISPAPVSSGRSLYMKPYACTCVTHPAEMNPSHGNTTSGGANLPVSLKKNSPDSPCQSYE